MNARMESQFNTAENASLVAYRLIYLQPSQYSDERITVGVALVDNGNVSSYFVSSQYARDTLATLYGKEFVDNFEFGIHYLRNELNSAIASIRFAEPLLDMFAFGEEKSALCGNKNLFARDILELASSLYRVSPFKARASKYLSQDEFSNALYDAVSIVNPMLATKVFKGVSIEIDSKKLSIPIYGETIIGAPISLVTKMVEDAVIKAEAYLARFNYARGILNRSPYIYALLPTKEMDVNHQIIRNSVKELEAVANANKSKIRVSDKINELAWAIEKDDRVAA